jgi:hypothetical protein
MLKDNFDFKMFFVMFKIWQHILNKNAKKWGERLYEKKFFWQKTILINITTLISNDYYKNIKKKFVVVICHD